MILRYSFMGMNNDLRVKGKGDVKRFFHKEIRKRKSIYYTHNELLFRRWDVKFFLLTKGKVGGKNFVKLKQR